MKEYQDPEPEIRLLASHLSVNACPVHKTENLEQIGNNDDWVPDFVAVDKMKFTCKVCDSVKVYQIMPEKTKLKYESN